MFLGDGALSLVPAQAQARVRALKALEVIRSTDTASVRAVSVFIQRTVLSFYMNKSRILYSILAIVFGAFMVVYGGMDDSPGGQLLGLLAVIIGIVGVIKSKKKNSD